MRFVGEDKDMPLCGSLIEASIDAPPEYYALSYTWGDPTLCASIEIDGKVLGITANCASALRRMLRGKAERYIWVDSICINQADTPDALEERGGQVAMMDRIYRSAIQVNVHLGEGDPAAEVAVVALKSLGTYCTGAMLPGPQQSFFRRKYESLADDVLSKKAFTGCCGNNLPPLTQPFSNNAGVSLRKAPRHVPSTMVQADLGRFKTPAQS